MWAAEVKKADVEGLAKWEEKELFKCVGHFLFVHCDKAQCLATLSNLVCCQDLHGGLQHGDTAAQEVLRPGRV